MTKKMKEILVKISTLTAEARTLQDKGDTEGATNKIQEISDLRAQYDNEKALYEMERDNVPEDPQPANRASGFAAMAKIALGQPLTDAENALVTGGENGENYLVPEDVNTTIRELRRTYVSAKEDVTVIPTTALTGSFPVESGTPAGLTEFEDGDDIPTDGDPKFTVKKWAIRLFGRIIPVSKTLLSSEKAGLSSYLNRLFVKAAVISENNAIFTALKTGKEAITMSGLMEVSSAINKELDPSALIGGKIYTNQTGFDILDSEVDEFGRPMLSKDLANPTQKLFKGLPIKVFPDAQLPNEGSNAPIFVGDFKAGINFIDKNGIEFASSEHAFFGKNQLALRVIEGFDVIQGDSEAYIYGLLSAPAAE